MTAHNDLLAATLASGTLVGAAVGAFLGLRRAERGQSLLNAPATPDQRQQLEDRGRTNLPKARIAVVATLALFTALLIITLAT